MHKNILIIDDDKEIREIVRLFLELEGYSVSEARAGIEGIEALRKSVFDLVLLDIGLPDVSGQQICRLIRAENPVPIIMLSARDSVSDKVICLDYGADDYLTKPFENIELLARIRAVERRTENRTKNDTANDKSELIAFHHININMAKRTVFKDNQPIQLTPKEFELLSYLYKNAGKVLARDKIVKDLWGDDALYKWSRSLDVHIQNLRQKVEINPKNPDIIQTVSGVGYKVKG